LPVFALNYYILSKLKAFDKDCNASRDKPEGNAARRNKLSTAGIVSDLEFGPDSDTHIPQTLDRRYFDDTS
jgi:hypothetical protein